MEGEENISDEEIRRKFKQLYPNGKKC